MSETKKEQPNYYAILTADVRYSKEINFFEKVLYADITALTNKNGYCTASNGYFAELFDKTKGTISKAISKFEKLGFLKVVITRDNATKQIIDRKLYLLTKISIPINENINTPIDENVNTPIDENIKENSININITSNNKKNKQKKSQTEILPPELNIEAFEMWIEYKGKSYSKQGRTLTINKLIKYPKDVQLQMVENSIMNNYKGLFEIKPQGNQVAQYQQPKQTIDPFELYTNYRNKGMDKEVATVRVITETGMKYPATDDFKKAINNAEFALYMQQREQQQTQSPASDEDYQEKLLKELYDEN